MTQKFFLQGITEDSHLEEIREILSSEEIESITVSVAFMTQRGLLLLADLIAPIANKSTFYIGIRNGITTAQGVLSCHELGCMTYLVDTGTRGVVFHPKLYFAKREASSSLIIGSANLTVGGLNSNIEASIRLDLDNKDKDDLKFVAEMDAKFSALRTNYPSHVIKVTSKKDVRDLFESGRLVDEADYRAPTPKGASAKRSLDSIPRISIHRKKVKLGPVTPFAAKAVKKHAKKVDSSGKAKAFPASKITIKKNQLVWMSKPLTRRALNIPTGANTSPTGSMLFTKGLSDSIDQRHYFRDEVFSDLDWSNDTKTGKEHLERATAQFEVVIKDVTYGDFELSLTHDSRIDSSAYLQKNSLTQLHWGDVKDLVAKEDLLDRTLSLFSDPKVANRFILEID